MRFLDSDLQNKTIKVYNFELGNLYLLENIVISEINEGQHISANNTDEYLAAISDFFGKEKAFGYISNRINSFSVQALDFKKLTNSLKNLKIFTTVTYKKHNDINTSIEQNFCDIPYIKHNSLINAYKYLNEYITYNKK